MDPSVQRTLHTNGQKRTLYTNRNELYTRFGGANFTHDSRCELYTRFLKSFICLNLLFKLDLSQFTNGYELNDYLQDKYNIPAFQHRLLQRLSIFSFKMLNFVSAPKTKFQELKSQETNNVTSFAFLFNASASSESSLTLPEGIALYHF